jgi:hypothetical protein
MRERAHIRTAFPTPEQTAELMGVGPRRAAQLIQMVEEALAKRGYGGATKDGESGTARSGTTSAEKNSGAAKSASAAKNGAAGGKSLSRHSKMRSRTRVKLRARNRNASRRKLARAKAKSSH